VHLRGKDAWSAVTIFCDAKPIVLVNETHGERRRESSLHHEAAHLLCGHRPQHVVRVGDWILRSYDAAMESEASWLGGCLQLPRPALYWAISHGLDDREIQERYVASDAMLKYRRAVTGVGRQLNAG
jgi:Zn-dependent peptidase ImmA (M78 family)